MLEGSDKLASRRVCSCKQLYFACIFLCIQSQQWYSHCDVRGSTISYNTDKLSAPGSLLVAEIFTLQINQADDIAARGEAEAVLLGA